MAAASAVVHITERNNEHFHRTFRERFPGTPNIERGESTWLTDYLPERLVYGPRHFRRRLRVPRALFWKLHDDLVNHYPHIFKQRRNAAKKKRIPSDIKILACLRLLGTGKSLDDMDDSCRMAPETLCRYFKQFCNCVIELYGPSFLNTRPSKPEMASMEARYAEAGFRGCTGAVDCCKLIWKNCPSAQKGQYHNSREVKLAIIQIEAWCDRELYVWHWNAGRSGTNNDKTLLAFSPLFNDILGGTFEFKLSQKYHICGSDRLRELPYFLVDGIYPNWPIFAKPIHEPDYDYEQNYTKSQEASRKDIERTFGVLQSRFLCLRRETHWWYKEDILKISYACVIIHNMMVRMNQRGEFAEDLEDEGRLFDIVGEMYEEELQLAAVSQT